MSPNKFLKLLFIHIMSKTTGSQFHKDTEKAYEWAFDCLHLTHEMEQDLWLVETTNQEKSGQESYDLIEAIKKELEDMVEENDNIWYDNRLRGLVERWVDLCGTFRQYTKEEDKEEPGEIETETETPPKKQLFNLK